MNRSGALFWLLTSTGQGNYFQIKTLLLPFGAKQINLECLEDVVPHVVGHCYLSASWDQPPGGGDTVIGISHCTLCCCTKIHGYQYHVYSAVYLINISVVTPCLSIWLDMYNWATNIWNCWNQQYFQAGSFFQERHAGSVLCAEDPGARGVHRERGVDGQLPEHKHQAHLDGVQLGHEHRAHLDQGGVGRLRLGQAGLGQGGHHRVALVLVGPGQLLLITNTRRLTPYWGRFREFSFSLNLFDAKLPTDWIQKIWLEEPWLGKDDNIRLFQIMCITWNFECQNILTILTRWDWYMCTHASKFSAADPTQVRWLSSHLLTEDHGRNIMELSVYVQNIFLETFSLFLQGGKNIHMHMLTPTLVLLRYLRFETLQLSVP